jgi:hypothetical protein
MDRRRCDNPDPRTVLTRNYVQSANGPLIPEVLTLFPGVPVIRQPGIISAWDDPGFGAAIEKTGRKNLIMADVTIDVCLALPAMQAVAAGYNGVRRGQCLRRT